MSLEYLALALVAIALLMLSVAALGSVKGYSDRSVDTASFSSSADRLHSAAMGVCALGSGNARSVMIRSSFSIEPTDGGYSIERGDLAIAKPMTCPIASSDITEGEAYVYNDEGTIRIEQDRS